MYLYTMYMRINSVDNIPSFLHLASIFVVPVMLNSITFEIPVLQTYFYTNIHLCTMHIDINILDNIPSMVHLLAYLLTFFHKYVCKS